MDSLSNDLTLYQLADLLIKLIGLLAVFLSAGYTLWNLRNTFVSNRHKQLNELQNEFLDPKIVSERHSVIRYWSKLFSQASTNNAESNLSGISKLSDEQSCIEFVAKKLGMTFSVPTEAEISSIDSTLIEQTNNVLNKYELLGKLYTANAVRKKDIQLFFYTSIAETFICTLPYILYRRRAKPKYAASLQMLIKIAPYVSSRLNEDIQLYHTTAHITPNNDASSL